MWRLADRRLFLPVCILFVALSVVCLFAVQIPEAVQYVPFAVGMVVLGLPHGALDHLVPARLAGRRPSFRTIAPVVALYGVLGAVVFALWWAASLLAFVFFIALTWFHWGQGDVFVRARLAEHPEPAEHSRPGGQPDPAQRQTPDARVTFSRRAARIGTLVVRGALPMLVPLIAFPQTFLAVANGATAIFGQGLTSGSGSTPTAVTLAVESLTSDTARITLAVALGAAAAVTVFLRRHVRLANLDVDLSGADRRGRGGLVATEGRDTGWLGDAAEVLVLALFFATVPPVLAVGLYFCLWHSLRHVVRLALLDERLRRPLAAGHFGSVFVGFTLQAAPITLIALGLLAGLYAVVPHAGADLGSLLGLYLVLISALTLPHVVIVTLMDRVQARQAR